jgi:hypothetical protein
MDTVSLETDSTPVAVDLDLHLLAYRANCQGEWGLLEFRTLKKLSIILDPAPHSAPQTPPGITPPMGISRHPRTIVPLFGLSYVHTWPLQVLNHIAHGWREIQNVLLAPLLAHCRSDRHGGAINALPRRSLKRDDVIGQPYVHISSCYFLPSDLDHSLKPCLQARLTERTEIGPLMNYQLEPPAPDA